MSDKITPALTPEQWEARRYAWDGECEAAITTWSGSEYVDRMGSPGRYRDALTRARQAGFDQGFAECARGYLRSCAEAYGPGVARPRGGAMTENIHKDATIRLDVLQGGVWSETEEIPVWAEVAKLPEAERRAITEKYMAKLADRALGHVTRMHDRYLRRWEGEP